MAEPKVLEKKQPKSSRKSVRLMARIPGATTVSITGTFSNWSEEGFPMQKNGGDQWEADLLLAPGEYQYRLRVDGGWQDHAEAAKRVPNPYGCDNCVLTVT